MTTKIEWAVWQCRDCGKKALFEFGIDDASLPLVCDLCGGTCRAVRFVEPAEPEVSVGGVI